MAKAARRYDIFLPLADNHGRPLTDQLFDGVERRLLAKFGGVTSQQRDFPLRGIWQGETQLYLDQVIVMTALDFRRSGSARFIATLKRELLRDFDQLEILITESALRVHRVTQVLSRYDAAAAVFSCRISKRLIPATLAIWVGLCFAGICTD